MRLEAVIFDFGRTLYDPSTGTTFPETHNTLEALKERELKLGLVSVTNTDDLELRVSELRDLGLRDFFSAIDIIGRTHGQKDFTKVLGALNLFKTPEKCAVVGDNLKKEIAAGNRIGAYTIWTKQRLLSERAPQDTHQIPKATINKIEELVPLIDSLNTVSF